ncbi:hypothetical protein HHI36_015182 [Cryptolaemus montrouzieri]|uniref:SREBP regulating gene protein n=1 Tax=Cryptolaemus montrouzieri TaxID=559131 RepID=A0ABD2N639_9CUCU
MWYAALIRFIRRRIILGIILTVSFVYCLLSYTGKGEFLSGGDEETLTRRTQPFVWRTLQQHNSSSDDIMCRNSVQGMSLIVDDRGYICPRQEILVGGCCNDAIPSVTQYSCDTCKLNNCCEIYEYCISCCLDPDKKEMLENLLEKAAEENNLIYASVTDHFELCLAKCRTSSKSVQHENSYRDPLSKFCFGEHSPGYDGLEGS